MSNLLDMKLGGPFAVSRGASAVDPPLTGLIARYRADNEVTGTTDVSAWGDMTANGNHLSQGTGANQPALVTGVVNGKPVIRFTLANNDFLRRASFVGGTETQPYTQVMIAARTSGSAVQWAVSAGNTSFRSLGYDSDNTAQMFAGGIFDTASVINTSFHSLIGIFNGASSQIFLDNSSIGTGDAGGGELVGLCIGNGDATSSSPFGGDIAEVLVYDHALDATERTALAAYVAAQYGI